MTRRSVSPWRQIRAAAYDDALALRGLTGTARPGWEHRAACAGLARDVTAADCTGCPVRLDCLRDAVELERTDPREGITTVRGGITPAARIRLYQHARRVGLLDPVRRPRAECNTPAGYRAHRRDGEDACPDCKAANARHAADLRHRARRHTEHVALVAV